MRIQYNSPVILTFSIVVVLIHVFSEFTSIDVSKHFFTIYDPMSIKDPIAYFRLFSHILGHASWSHLTGNLTLVLLLGPILEERYGSRTVLIMILATALITGFVHIAVPLFDNMGLRGASGIVFMLIVMHAFIGLWTVGTDYLTTRTLGFLDKSLAKRAGLLRKTYFLMFGLLGLVYLISILYIIWL